MESGLAYFKILLSQIPSLTSRAILHTLGRTPTSSKWDLRTELTVVVLRDWMGVDKKPMAVSKAQAQTIKDPGVKGKMWIATETIPAPVQEAKGLRDAVLQAIEDMKTPDAGVLRYTKPDLVDIEVEWMGFRPDAGKDEPLPDIPDEEKYKKMMAEPSRTSETTILYFHGGGYYLCDPATHRLVCSRLAKESHGRVCSVRYRLAPQTAFPGQLLDAFMVYLSLLYPPPGSMHEAVPANTIVFSGDSAGGNLSFALLQLLLQLHRTSKNPTVRFHGKEIPVPLPAGACANSGWFDIPLSTPSIQSNAQYDYLPAVNHDNPSAIRFPADSAWPTDPLRGDLFCDLSLVDHPLTSLMNAESWAGAPPMWVCIGQEQLADQSKLVAARAAAQGVQVQFEDYEAMPHVFAMLLPALAASGRCMRNWGDFCRRCVEEAEDVKTNGTFVYVDGKEEKVDVSQASGITAEEARAGNRDAKERRIRAFEKWQKAGLKSSL
jgi:acetyl esterase/lipase